MPQHKTSEITTTFPKIKFFINNINKNRYFSIVKYSLEWWMMVHRGIIMLGMSSDELTHSTFSSEEFIYNLSIKMKDKWEGQRGRRPWKFNIAVVCRLLRALFEDYPDNMLFSASFGRRYLPKSGPLINPSPVRTSTMYQSVKQITGLSRKTFFNVLIWRVWSGNGDIHKLITFAKNREKLKVVIVGPYFFYNFGYKLGISNFQHIEIHYTDAVLHIEETKKAIIKNHKKLIRNGDDVLYLFVGGSVAMWLILELHGILEKAFMIDIGRALDAYYLYDDIRKITPKWQWGNWLVKRRPEWILNLDYEVENGVVLFGDRNDAPPEPPLHHLVEFFVRRSINKRKNKKKQRRQLK